MFRKLLWVVTVTVCISSCKKDELFKKNLVKTDLDEAKDFLKKNKFIKVEINNEKVEQWSLLQ